MNDIENSLLPAVTVNNGIVTTCNDTFTELIGFSPLEIIGTRLEDKLSIVADIEEDKFTLKQLFSGVSSSELGMFTMGTIKDKCHYALPVKVHCHYAQGGGDTFRLCFRVLENKSKDCITGLPNGVAMRARVIHHLQNPAVSVSSLGLIILSVDNFSTINFRYGFEVGDDYLSVLGKTLQAVAQGVGFVVRYANAKFGILVEDYNGLSSQQFSAHIAQFCHTLCQTVAKPLILDNNLKISKYFSIGVSAQRSFYDSYFAMEIATETAMLEAKKHSVTKYCLATTQTTDDLLTNKLIIDEFPRAIELHQINIHYQPQYEFSSGKLIGLEALSRWCHKELGNVSPDVFVGVAEDIGLHFEFDLWVFTQVCCQIVEWQALGIEPPRVAINISFKTLEMAIFISRISDVIKQTNCPTRLIEIEVTETASINNIKTLGDNILEVKKLGINIAVDDFGSGYSSLSLVRTFHLSLNKLKIDRTLIHNICNTALDREFAKHIIGLGKVLQVKVLVEGVETREQHDLLKQLGCDYAQGYYFAKALSKQQTEQLIRHELLQDNITSY